MSTRINDLEKTIEEAESKGLTIESLRALEKQAEDLSALNLPAAPYVNMKPADLGAYERAVIHAARVAARSSAPIHVCDLARVPDPEGRAPRMDELMRDPELGKVVAFLRERGNIIPYIALRRGEIGFPARAGDTHEPAPDRPGGTSAGIPCLVIKRDPGVYVSNDPLLGGAADDASGFKYPDYPPKKKGPGFW